MADNEPTPRPQDRDRDIDPVTLTAGLITVAFAFYAGLGGPWTPQWLLAIGAVAVGAVMLVVSLRPRG